MMNGENVGKYLKGKDMVYWIADNVLTPMGLTTMSNYWALREGHSALKQYASYSGKQDDDYVASRFSDEQRKELMINGLTWFESLVYHSMKDALTSCNIDVTSNRTILIVSTTKANIDCLSSEVYDNHQPAESVKKIADIFGFNTIPIVVCNACISGVAAIITAQRLLNADIYDTAIVVGCDVVSHFIVSGFQSLKAMSPEPCRPFDIERVGLNLGEAAATLILSRNNNSQSSWHIENGAIRNDAYHISSPSPKGEGCANAIKYVIEDIDIQSISALNVHGTATMYNDQMESKAIAASGLSNIPSNTLKGYLGHTLGASGILETIITKCSVEQGELLATRGFNEIGVSGRVNISNKPFSVDKNSFVKIISGFGGCNAAIYCSNAPSSCNYNKTPYMISLQHNVKISPSGVVIDGEKVDVEAKAENMLTEIYKSKIGSYPKFYKMDKLSQLGFVASELLLSQENPREEQNNDRAVILFNHSSSICVDREYEKTISIGEDYFPSPSLFVYTLPNIVCGEIALRNGYHSETSFYIISKKDEIIMNKIIEATFTDKTLNSVITGWVDYQNDNTYEADIKLIKKI